MIFVLSKIVIFFSKAKGALARRRQESKALFALVPWKILPTGINLEFPSRYTDKETNDEDWLKKIINIVLMDQTVLRTNTNFKSDVRNLISVIRITDMK